MRTKILYHQDGKITYGDGRSVRYASVSTLDEAAIKRACDSTQRAWLTQSLASILDDVLAVKAAPESERRALLDAAKNLHDGGDLLVDRGDDFGAVAGVLRLFGEVADLLAKGVSVRGDLRRDEAVVDDRHESSPSTGGGDAATSPAGEASVGEATVEPAGSSPACCCSCGAACSAGAGVTPVERARRIIQREEGVL